MAAPPRRRARRHSRVAAQARKPAAPIRVAPRAAEAPARGDRAPWVAQPLRVVPLWSRRVVLVVRPARARPVRPVPRVMVRVERPRSPVRSCQRAGVVVTVLRRDRGFRRRCPDPDFGGVHAQSQRLGRGLRSERRKRGLAHPTGEQRSKLGTRRGGRCSRVAEHQRQLLRHRRHRGRERELSQAPGSLDRCTTSPTAIRTGDTYGLGTGPSWISNPHRQGRRSRQWGSCCSSQGVTR